VPRRSFRDLLLLGARAQARIENRNWSVIHFVPLRRACADRWQGRYYTLLYSHGILTTPMRARSSFHPLLGPHVGYVGSPFVLRDIPGPEDSSAPPSAGAPTPTLCISTHHVNANSLSSSAEVIPSFLEDAPLP
jgi:hypothetical protein